MDTATTYSEPHSWRPELHIDSAKDKASTGKSRRATNDAYARQTLVISKA